MSEMIARFALDITLMVLTGAVGWLRGKIAGAAKERREADAKTHAERDQSRAATRLLLWYRLKDLFDQYVVDGAPMSGGDKHEIEEVYKLYKEFGGNGEGTRMYHALMELKTTI